MEYKKYTTEKRNLLENIHQFIDEESTLKEKLNVFIRYLQTNNYEENIVEFKLILHTINNISNNHHRYQTFLMKIKEFLKYYSEYIKKHFTDYEIFNIFQNNKLILHFLIQNKIITVNKNIANLIIQKDEKEEKQFHSYFVKDREKALKYFKRNTTYNYCYYFFHEIQSFLREEKRTQIERELFEKHNYNSDEFENNRQIGENESYICQLIRQDSIKEFVIYINQNNIQFSSEINHSIFETNHFLLKRNTSLIEYAAFFGSIQIFQYLQLNNSEMTSHLWLFAIHGKNPEIIQILIENNIKPEDDTYVECLQESIKCHHNDIANYIIDNLMPLNIEINEENFIFNKHAFGFHYHNYEFIQNFQNYQFIFYYACLFDYFTIVKLLVSENKINLTLKIIKNQQFFYPINIYVKTKLFFIQF